MLRRAAADADVVEAALVAEGDGAAGAGAVVADAAAGAVDLSKYRVPTGM